MTTAAVCMTPLAVYGLERLLKLQTQGSGSYLDEAVRENRVYMEIATMAAGAVALRFVRFPFLTAPLAFALWIMSMDVAPLLLGWKDITWSRGLWVSVIFGLAMLLAAYSTDRRTKDDYAFWLYLFGVMAFWCGLTFQENGSPWARFAYCLLNIAMLAVSTFLDRRVFAVFGSVGIAVYLGYLAFSLFRDSLLLPVALTGIGLAVIAAAIAYQKNRAKVDALLIGSLPEGLRRLSPAGRK